LTHLAEELYRLIRSGEDNVTRVLNLTKTSAPVSKVTEPRAREIQERKAAADRKLLDVIDARNLPPEALPTACLLSVADLVQTKDQGEAMVLTCTSTAPGQESWPTWPLPQHIH